MRDNKRLNKLRALPCCNCGKPAPSQAAHSNQGNHGKGMAIKANDAYTIPLCHHCHASHDQYVGSGKSDADNWFNEKLAFINEVLNDKDKSVF